MTSTLSIQHPFWVYVNFSKLKFILTTLLIYNSLRKSYKAGVWSEYDCCEVIIDKVLPTLSQGHLENVRMPLDQVQPGGLQIREYVAVVKNDAGDKKKKAPAKDIFADDKAKW